MDEDGPERETALRRNDTIRWLGRRLAGPSSPRGSRS